MNKQTIDISDLSKLDKKLSMLDDYQCNEVLFKAVKAGANVLKETTRQSLVSKMGESATRSITKKDRTLIPLVDNIKSNNNRAMCEAKVYLTGYAMWFEKGTNIRKTKKGFNRGNIEGINYFLAARENSENQINDSIKTTIEKNIDRILG